MRFESLLWSILAMVLAMGQSWELQTPVNDAAVDGTTATDTFRASDSGSETPPPRP